MPPKVFAADEIRLAKGARSALPTIAVVNKIDRSDARPEEVVDEIYDLFLDLDATDEQIEFPILYAVSRERHSETKTRRPNLRICSRCSNRS